MEYTRIILMLVPIITYMPKEMKGSKWTYKIVSREPWINGRTEISQVQGYTMDAMNGDNLECERYNNEFIEIVFQIRSLNGPLFKNCDFILRWYLQNIGLETILPGSFTGLTEARLINLQDNNIENITHGVFNGLRYLSVINLSNNRIKIISEHAFNGLQYLRDIHLGQNNLVHLDTDLFNSVSTLNTLNISSNKLSDFNFLFHLEKIDTLDASFNNFSTINLNSAIKYFNLSHNYLTDVIDINDRMFDLDLSFNRIQNCSCNYNEYLHNLNLSHNCITAIETDTFSNIYNLQSLDVSFNKIDVIEKNAFLNLSTLNSLFLHHNVLNNLQTNCLKQMENLKVLDLSHNQFSYFQFGLFNNLRNLRSLNISNNNIGELNLDLFNDLTSLIELNIENISISFLDTAHIRYQLPNLRIIYLNSNYWNCYKLSRLLLSLKFGRITLSDGNDFDKENVHGIKCSTGNQSQKEETSTNALLDKNTVSELNENMKLSIKLSKVLNEDFSKSELFKYFNENFKKSNFFKYLEDFKNPKFLISNTENMNNTKVEKIIGVSEQKDDTIHGLLILNAIFLICILAVVTYHIFFQKNKKGQSGEIGLL